MQPTNLLVPFLCWAGPLCFLSYSLLVNVSPSPSSQEFPSLLSELTFALFLLLHRGAGTASASGSVTRGGELVIRGELLLVRVLLVSVTV